MLRKADRLIVLDKGEIVEIGNHEQLMQAQGTYHQLYQAQARQCCRNCGVYLIMQGYTI
jgi:ATP-binding cassette subfamily B protein